MRKRLVMLVTFFFLVVFMAGCFSPADSVGIPKGYIEKEEYYDKDGFQDYTDYAKYIYSSKDIIVNDDKYFEIKEEDISNIKGYFQNFSELMEANKRLDEKIINEGDYARIETKEGEKIGDSKYQKYDNYSIYFFDMETLTLYYIHYNI